MQPRPFGKNVGVDLGTGCGVADPPVVTGQLVGAGRQVIGRDRGDPGRAERDRGPGQPDGVPGVRRADVRDHPVRPRLGQGQLEQR